MEKKIKVCQEFYVPPFRHALVANGINSKISSLQFPDFKVSRTKKSNRVKPRMKNLQVKYNKELYLLQIVNLTTHDLTKVCQ